MTKQELLKEFEEKFGVFDIILNPALLNTHKELKNGAEKEIAEDEFNMTDTKILELIDDLRKERKSYILITKKVLDVLEKDIIKKLNLVNPDSISLQIALQEIKVLRLEKEILELKLQAKNKDDNHRNLFDYTKYNTGIDPWRITSATLKNEPLNKEMD